MVQRKTKYDRLLDRFKNNPITVVLLILGTIIVGIGSVTDALDRILEVFKFTADSSVPQISGRWATDTIQYEVLDNDMDYKYIFDFMQVDESVSGEVARDYIAWEKDDSWAIIDGELKGNTISFYTKGTYENINLDSRVLSTERADYKVSYIGTITGSEIHFILQDDRGYKPIKLIATKE